MPYRKEEKLPDNFGIDWASGKEIGHKGLLVLIYYFKKTFCSTLNSRIGELANSVIWCHEQVKKKFNV